MRRNRSLALLLILGVAAGVVLSGCKKKEAAVSGEGTGTPAAAATAKIPVTTSSDEARTEFLTGRDKVEKLQLTDSIAHFQKAVSLDPNFAWAELFLSGTAPTANEFFEHLNKAVSLASKASSGEKLLILATEAGVNGNPVKSKEYLDQLVSEYPNDERAHFALGGYYFGQQEYPQAIEHYKKATEINPSYSTAFNILGYAYRQAGDYGNAEKAFQQYIALIPNDPNPYDSYAELLLKMGRFDDSIAQYRKALAIDPSFIASYNGIATDLMYMGKTGEAAAEIENLSKKARNDGETRTALFDMTILYVDGGKMGKALEEVDKQYALGEKTNDAPAMAGDLQLKGDILLEMGKYDQAKAAYDSALKMTEESNLSKEIKDNTKVDDHYNRARVAVGKKDYATAKAEAEEFRKGAEASKNTFQIWQAHELLGIIALAQKDYDTAIAELQQANQQNTYNLYRLCQAYQGKGDKAKAKEMCAKAADFNPLPALNHAFIRTKAKAGAKG